MSVQQQDLSDLLPVVDPSSPEARALSDLFTRVTIVGAAIFVLVAALVAYALVRYRGSAQAFDPPSARASYGVEIAWTITPLLLLAIIFGFTLRTLAFVNPEPPAGAAPDLVVRGNQWWWGAYYPETGVRTANEIHIPTGRRLLVRIESADVVHSFWVPALARKIDMIPGRENHLWIEADSAGVYQGWCAEFCGVQHAHMRFLVIAEPDSAFAAWQAAQLEAPVRPASELGRQGQSLLAVKACLNCHQLGGAGGSVAPDLTHVGSRRTLAAATILNTPANLTRWLREPGAVKPGTKMPNFQLTEPEIAALVAYLGGLR